MSRSFFAFNAPTIQQRLNLSEQQLELLNRYGDEWRAELGEWAAESELRPQAVSAMLNEAREEFFSRVNATLTTEQRRIWQAMIGEPFSFPAGVYFSQEIVALVSRQSTPLEDDLTSDLPDL